MHSQIILFKPEFWESDVLPGKTEVKQGKFVKFISRAKFYFRETYKSHIQILKLAECPLNINNFKLKW